MAINLNGTTGITTTGLTSNGIDDNATSTAMTLDTSGNLLVGKTLSSGSTQGVQLQAAGNVFATASNDYPLYLNRLGSDGQLAQFRKDGTQVGSIGVDGSHFEINTEVGTGALSVGGSRKFQWANTVFYPLNDNSANLGHGAYRFKDLYLSGGVYLGGTGSANKLDDYEEGTWTPTFGAEGANPTMTYNAQVGRYTKIGNLVTAYCQIITASRSGGSGNLTVDGLPFTVAPAVQYASATIGFNFNWNTPPLNAGAQGSTTHVILYQDARTNIVSAPVDIVASGSSYFYFVVSYETTL
jgi:hypothetical protein